MVAGDSESQQVCSEASSSQKAEEFCSEGRFKEAEKAYTELLEKAEGEELALVYNNRGHARWILCFLPMVKHGCDLLLAGTCRSTSKSPNSSFFITAVKSCSWLTLSYLCFR